MQWSLRDLLRYACSHGTNFRADPHGIVEMKHSSHNADPMGGRERLRIEILIGRNITST